MASLLRSIIAGPRAKHAESNLDLCYVTPFLIATSGPSGTYPQRAYRNPLDQLLKFLDKTHGEDWCIWEFRAEGTGYPDDAVYGRVRHYPWPDHHPPPFAVVPMVMGSMRQWLAGSGGDEKSGINGRDERGENKRVVIVHCKAGKGRSGTMASSYLISECGWKADEALARFTERRMRPGFGQGVSIPSQLRWVGYVDRWTKGGKLYVEKEVEILEVHVWGLRDGVKVAVEGFINEGKTIKTFHVFNKKERMVEGTSPGGAGITDMISDMAGLSTYNTPDAVSNEAADAESISKKIAQSRKITNPPDATSGLKPALSPKSESGGSTVMFKPATPIIVPSTDVNIDFERRNKAGYGLAMVTSVAHVWFNAFFEGRGPEQEGKGDESGVFEIEWDKMDGIKGSLRKGTRAFDRLAVVWKVREPPGGAKPVLEPSIHSPIEQMQPADWKGEQATPGDRLFRDLGIRTESPASAEVSKASSVKSLQDGGNGEDDDSFQGLRRGGVEGTEDGDGLATDVPSGTGTGNHSNDVDVDVDDVEVAKLPQPTGGKHVPDVEEVNSGLDTASSTTPRQV